MKQSVMILGAGVYQVPLIQKAKEMGFETIVASPSGDYPGIFLADKFLDLDTTDIDQVVLAAKKHGISGIATTGTDVSVPTIGAVVDALGVNGPTQKMAKIVSSKTAFRTFLYRNSLPCPKFKVCEGEQDALRFYSECNERVVLKPDDSSGSRGVSILEPGHSDNVVKTAYHNAKFYSRSGLVCAEAFIPGTEVGGDAFLMNGNLSFFATTCKHMNGVVVQGHSLPGKLEPNQEASIKSEIERTARCLGYENGPINFDVMVNEGSATILEMGLRNGGNGILDLILHGYQVDLTELLLKYVLDKPASELKISTVREVSSYVFGAETAGQLVAAPVLDDIRTVVPEVFDLILAKKVGDQVDSFIHNANLIGYVLFYCGDLNYSDVVSRIKTVLAKKVVIS